ncbi:Protein CBG16325 [Caenorhabditis briggsae]|uniref:Protein CBG16325 n=1 Tax=Caenorhabditis briggsae TaxID=6238 RepID=A8XNP2_CAEBR|nr:Protein CBG16325 [Caenorhabditis briggsae]CAP34131.2 Protein CBG16325 [Caenorhabditis briggsae]
MLHREPRLQPDKKRRDDTKEIFDELKELLRIPRPTKIRLLEEIARRWEIIDEIKIDSKFCADKQITVALEPLAEHIRRQVEYEFDLSTKLKKLEAILIVLKSELNGEVVTTNASNISSSNQSITPNSHSLAENQPPPSIDVSGDHISDDRRLENSKTFVNTTSKGKIRRVHQKRNVHPSGESRIETKDGAPPISKRAAEAPGPSAISLQPLDFFTNSSHASSLYSIPILHFVFPEHRPLITRLQINGKHLHISPPHPPILQNTLIGTYQQIRNWNSTPQNTQMTTDLISTSQFQVQQKLIKQPGFLDAKRSQRKELNNQNLSSLSICLSNLPVNNPFNQEIRFCDLIHLQPERWLNEYLIEFSIDRLASEYLNPDQQKTVHLFDTTFFRRRAEEIVTAVPRKSREEMAESMKKMCIEKQERKRKIPIFERDLLVFPINHSHHWILCVVINPKGAIVEEGKDKNNNKCRIIVFDSIDCTVRKKDVVMFMTIYMRQQFERVWKLNGVLQEDRIEIPEVKHPYKQLNEYDCGVYTILFARSIICNYIQFQKAQNEHQFDLCKFDRNARNADSINLRTAMLNWFLELVDEEFCPELNMDTLIKIAPGYRDIIKTKPMY